MRYKILVALLTTLVTASLIVAPAAVAKKKTPHEQWTACHQWCEAKNRTPKSRETCARQCNRYYKVGGARQ